MPFISWHFTCMIDAIRVAFFIYSRITRFYPKIEILSIFLFFFIHRILSNSICLLLFYLFMLLSLFPLIRRYYLSLHGFKTSLRPLGWPLNNGLLLILDNPFPSFMITTFFHGFVILSFHENPIFMSLLPFSNYTMILMMLFLFPKLMMSILLFDVTLFLELLPLISMLCTLMFKTLMMLILLYIFRITIANFRFLLILSNNLSTPLLIPFMTLLIPFMTLLPFLSRHLLIRKNGFARNDHTTIATITRLHINPLYIYPFTSTSVY